MSILDLQKSFRQLGRLRMGEKGPKGEPRKLNTWRLTSPNVGLLDEAAQIWGGAVSPWDDEHQLITEAASLPVIVPPQSVDTNQNYELYTAGGLQRRCDGQHESVSDKDCLCDPDNRECKPTTHALFMLPDLADIGVWRLTTRGWNAAVELGSTLRFVMDRSQKTGELLVGEVALEQRSVKRPGEPEKKFVVPVLRLSKKLGEFLPVRSELSEGVSSPDALPAPAPTVETEGQEAEVVVLPLAPSKESPPGGSEAESVWMDALSALIEEEPTAEMSMPDIEASLRKLFRFMNLLDYWPGEDPLHAGLAKEGVKHVGDFRKAELLSFSNKAWEAARAKLS